MLIFVNAKQDLILFKLSLELLKVLIDRVKRVKIFGVAFVDAQQNLIDNL